MKTIMTVGEWITWAITITLNLVAIKILVKIIIKALKE